MEKTLNASKWTLLCYKFHMSKMHFPYDFRTLNILLQNSDQILISTSLLLILSLIFPACTIK
jgi:hypothetical protein